MMMRYDEPLSGYPSDFENGKPAAVLPLEQRIRNLITSERFGVLCTQGQRQPYGSLVSFAVSHDLKYAAFATATATRKYRLLSECRNVALVIDSRSSASADLMKVEAVTATGRATELSEETEKNVWLHRLIVRHPHLEAFFKSSATAVFRIEIDRYLHVSKFQEVQHWIP